MYNIFPSPAERGFIHCYKLCGYNIVLDVASGSVHSVDDVVYDVMQLYELIIDGKSPDVLIARVSELHPNVTESDVRAILDDIEKLVDSGRLFSKDNFEHIAQKQAGTDTPFKALCLNVSHACNMSCAYCFANTSVTTGIAPQGNDVPDNETLMSFGTGKQAIDFLVQNSGGTRTLDIDFFGGEPLLNWQVIKEIVAYARMAEKFTGKKFRFTLTTNGLLIDDDVIEFTTKQFHNVVLSLDGRPEVHDAMRKVPALAGARQIESDASICESGIQGSYDAVLPKIRKLVEQRREHGYYIRGTYTRKNLDFTNDVLHLAGLGFSQISLEPAVTKRGGPQNGLHLGITGEDLPELLRQYDILAVEMKKRKDDMSFVRPQDVPKGYAFSFYHYNLDLECGPCIHKRIAGCGVATQYLAVTPGGELYPCHQFIGDTAFKMGDVWQGVTNRSLRSQFAAANIYTRPQCKVCWARFYCSGGCAANAFHDTGSINGVYEIGCELFKKRIENAIMLQL